MSKIKGLQRGWRTELSRLMRSAKDDVCIASPYVTREATAFLAQSLTDAFRSNGRMLIITDLSPTNIISGATEPAAFSNLANCGCSLVIRHLPSLHAKVYIADTLGAIVTSGNLTTSGLDRNYEYGVLVEESASVETIRRDISAYSELGAFISPAALSEYCHTAKKVRDAFLQQQRNIAADAKRDFERLLYDAENQLIALRLSGASRTRVFEKTVEYILSKDGALTTPQIHSRVQAIHPDLCDDRTDRVINGRHFGKEWKHSVRTAQAHMKEAGRIWLLNGHWSVASSTPI